MKWIVSVPFIWFPTPWARQPNSLAAEMFQASLNPGCWRSWWYLYLSGFHINDGVCKAVTPHEYVGSTVVIGGGNSACDVAVESSRVAAAVDMSWRRGYWIAPKFMMGKPADVFSTKIHWLPRFLWQKLSALSLYFRNGKNSDYGLPEPEGPKKTLMPEPGNCKSTAK